MFFAVPRPTAVAHDTLLRRTNTCAAPRKREGKFRPKALALDDTVSRRLGSRIPRRVVQRSWRGSLGLAERGFSNHEPYDRLENGMRKQSRQVIVGGCCAALVSMSWLSPLHAQGTTAQTSSAATAGAPEQGVVTPPDYVIGPDDQLSVVFYHDKDMSAGVVV